MAGRRALWSMRAFALAAFLGAFVATHWPALELGAGMPGDTLLHAITFAALTLLLWRARVVPGLGWLVAAMLAWAAIDELTQSIPWLRRHASLPDYIADAIGITIAAMAIATVPRPVGALGRMHRDLTDAAQLRATLHEQVTEVADALRRQQLQATTVKLKVRWADFTTLTRQSTLPRPTEDAATLYAAVVTLFDRVWEAQPVQCR